MKVSQIRDRIVDAIGVQAHALRLEPCSPGCFADACGTVTRMLTVSFLDRRHAASFGASTASFSVEVGVWYSGRRKGHEQPPTPPRHFECHVRHLLVKSLRQEPPSSDLSEPDKARRDIWWVGAEGQGLDRILTNASTAVEHQAQQFFVRFSNLKRAERYFKLWWLTQRLPGAPFNVGRPGSPGHKDLLAVIDATGHHC